MVFTKHFRGMVQFAPPPTENTIWDNKHAALDIFSLNKNCML